LIVASLSLESSAQCLRLTSLWQLFTSGWRNPCSLLPAAALFALNRYAAQPPLWRRAAACVKTNTCFEQGSFSQHLFSENKYLDHDGVRACTSSLSNLAPKTNPLDYLEFG
jgi:hypothetical protein